METESPQNTKLEEIRAQFYDFLDQYTSEADQASSTAQTAATADSSQLVPYYIKQLRLMRDSQKTTLSVDWQHLVNFDPDLAEYIHGNHHRAEPALRKALQNLVKTHVGAHSVNETDQSEKEFWVAFYNLANPTKLRQLRTEEIGKLRAFSGTVTRTSEVRPELFLAVFKCLECNTVVHDVEQQMKWTTPVICTNDTCGNRCVCTVSSVEQCLTPGGHCTAFCRRKWKLMREESKFIDWQKVKVQEKSDEVFVLLLEGNPTLLSTFSNHSADAFCALVSVLSDVWDV